MNDIAQKRIAEFHHRIVETVISNLGYEHSLDLKVKLVKILSLIGNQDLETSVFGFLKNNIDQEEAIIAACRFQSEEIDKFLFSRVADKRATHRDLITEQLGFRKNDAVLNVLVNLLDDENRHVRFQAASSLFNIGGKEAALALCKYISDPDEWISMTILRYLCILKEHETIPILSEKFHQDEDLRRKALMVSFLSRFNSVTLINIFDEGIRGRDARLKANSIEAIGNLNLPEGEIKKRIEPYLRDPNNRIRANSILALARSEPDKVKPEIAEMVASNDIQLRRSAAFILGMIPSDGNKELAEILIKDSSVAVRKRMVISLNNFSSDFVCDQLETTLNDSDKWIRKHSIDMASRLTNFPHDSVLNLLKTERAAPNLEACMKFFARKPSEKALPNLKLHVKDRRFKVIKALLEAVVSISGIDGVKKLAPRLDQRDPKIVDALTEIFLKAGERKILDDLAEKFASINKEDQLLKLVPSVVSCVEILSDPEKIPEPLLESLEALELEEKVVEEAIEPEVEEHDSNDEGSTDIDFIGQIPVPELPTGEGARDLPSLLELSELAASRKAKPKTPKSFRSGVKAFNMGKLKKAQKEFNKLLEEEDEVPEKTYYYMGMICFELEKFEQARDFLQTYLRSSPDNSKVNYILGKVLKSLKNWSGLVKVYSRFAEGKIDASPKMKKKIYLDLGIANILIGKYDRGAQLLESLYKLDNENPEVVYYLAFARFNSGKLSAADALLDSLLKGNCKSKRYLKLAQALKKKMKGG